MIKIHDWNPLIGLSRIFLIFFFFYIRFFTYDFAIHLCSMDLIIILYITIYELLQFT